METLREVRKKANLTQVGAAKLCGVSRRTYQTYEEKGPISDVYDVLLQSLKEGGFMGDEPALLSARYIKSIVAKIFAQYKEVRCAFLFGSYARDEATAKSDVDILIVAEPMGLEFYGLASDLEGNLGKSVDLLTHRQLLDNEEFLARVLKEAIKIYG